MQFEHIVYRAAAVYNCLLLNRVFYVIFLVVDLKHVHKLLCDLVNIKTDRCINTQKFLAKESSNETSIRKRNKYFITDSKMINIYKK